MTDQTTENRNITAAIAYRKSISWQWYPVSIFSSAQLSITSLKQSTDHELLRCHKDKAADHSNRNGSAAVLANARLNTK